MDTRDYGLASVSKVPQSYEITRKRKRKRKKGQVKGISDIDLPELCGTG